MRGKQFAVLHIEKGSGNATRLGSHIERKHQPPNANPDKAHLNQHLITGRETLNKDIDNRISQAGAKVRKNSVKHLNIVLSGSHERMKEIENDPKALQKWVKENRKFLENKYGEKNIMRLSLHLDERTPHLHAVIVPIIKKNDQNRLSARDVVGNRNDMQQLQDDYANKMGKFDLNRGVRGSKATHDSIKEYYARINKPVESLMQIPQKKPLESHTKYMKKLSECLEPIVFTNRKLTKDNTEMKEALNDLEKEKATMKREAIEKMVNVVNKNLKDNDIKYKYTLEGNSLDFGKVKDQQQKPDKNINIDRRPDINQRPDKDKNSGMSM